jgi:hypothetical protein
MLEFNEERHEYRFNGVIVPSVTTILKPLVDYSMIHPERLKAASELGSMVHLTTELYDTDQLDEGDLDPILKPYLDGWKLFRHEVGFVPDTVEKRMYHPTFGYCGTSDRTGVIRGTKAVLDIKKMMVLGPVIGPQLAAYKEMHNLEGAGIVKRYALGLRPDGSYRLQEFTDPTDLPCFMSLLTVMRAQETIHKWRAKHGK